MPDDASPLVWLGIATVVAGVLVLGLRERRRVSVNPSASISRLPESLPHAVEKQALLAWLNRYREAYLPYCIWSASVDAGLDQAAQQALGLDGDIPDKPVMQITDAMKGLNPVAFEQAALELARERGLSLEDPRRPYSALCRSEKSRAIEIAKATVQMARE
jgi:hypothetical protein